MINQKEAIAIIVITIVLGFLISLVKSVEIFLYALLAVFLVVVINVIAKKIAGYYLESEIEVKLWETQRYGFKAHKYFKKPFPTGVFLPILTTIISLGYVVWMACLTFEVKPKVHRAAKRHGLYSFSEMTEHHLGLMAAAGILANLIFAIIGYLTGFTDFARLNIYYAFFNMLPISNLDGNKIFFGNLVIWSFLAALVLIGLGYVFLVI